ncbi:hypothetical protein BO78DRAFT_399888 [Aspergillus sclerotiicarbonarius CBS 121057]|uniref:Uncharacterized protein n=1 Tax=Aspergillus sclerotiicarbonarius (strain CBS 121057 / IBT 28362) TaxID=1448318 RepID=A0A319E4X6_ASPSB|nr:hypothetical protein BO78DRAFT_399888 [Aspergillus sclerotiicarbonarius CBS 121057]
MSLRVPLRRIRLSRALFKRPIPHHPPPIRSLSTVSLRLTPPRSARPVVSDGSGYIITTNNNNATAHRAYSTTTGKPTADLIVDELQELFVIIFIYPYAYPSFSFFLPFPFHPDTPKLKLTPTLTNTTQRSYEVAKDEFEIATESTDSATIYAASDRESARDALDELVAVYTVYTRDGSFVNQSAGTQGQEEGQGLVDVDTGLNPEEVEEGVRGEVKRRVGTRVRELVAAVEALEERANAHD